MCFYEIERALVDTSYLDGLGDSTSESRNVELTEEASAAWQTEDRVIITGGDEPLEEVDEPPSLRPRGIVVYDIPSAECATSCVLEQPAGTVMAVGDSHVVAFYGHPRLVRLSDGVVVDEWPELASGEQLSCIIAQRQIPLPHIALDPAHRRFAVACEGGIHVITIQLDEGRLGPQANGGL